MLVKDQRIILKSRLHCIALIAKKVNPLKLEFLNQAKNWFQYVRRVYATAINFPCIIRYSHPAVYPHLVVNYHFRYFSLYK